MQTKQLFYFKKKNTQSDHIHQVSFSLHTKNNFLIKQNSSITHLTKTKLDNQNHNYRKLYRFNINLCFYVQIKNEFFVMKKNFHQTFHISNEIQTVQLKLQFQKIILICYHPILTFCTYKLQSQKIQLVYIYILCRNIFLQKNSFFQKIIDLYQLNIIVITKKYNQYVFIIFCKEKFVTKKFIFTKDYRFMLNQIIDLC
eukprot:TRINITY_DN4534_c0_g2_i5.p1 TRINITY_DN4534_c0_g2~~TRINITY_DN4534_c0_g2_i5.p1  ORF type:complete len:199 (+),score=-25.78 TRINITY_DN4534_c0_g2_i5:160-756(+)